MEPKKLNWGWILPVALGLFLIYGGGGFSLPAWPGIPSIAPSKPTLIVMLHEGDKGPLAPYVRGAANDLIAAGREVRMVDDDLLTGTGEVPPWLAPALAPGRALMGSEQNDDALVLLAGERVVKAIKMPATKAEILEACK